MDMSPFHLNDYAAAVDICGDGDSKERDAGRGEVTGERQMEDR